MILCDLDGNVMPGTPGQRSQPVERHRGARLRVPAHARGRRRRAHPLDLRRRLGRARRGDPVRHHGDGRRVRRPDPDRPVRDHRRRLDRPRHRRDADAATGRRAVLMQNHGPFTIGATAKDAVKAAVMVEDVARTRAPRPRGGARSSRSRRTRSTPLRPLPERLRTEWRRTTMTETAKTHGCRARRDPRGAHVARHRARLDAHQGLPRRADDPTDVLAIGSHEWENQLRRPRLDLLARRRLVGPAGGVRRPRRRRAAPLRRAARRRSARSASRR